MIQEYLSDIELFYSTEIEKNIITLSGDEFRHAIRVMRHKISDTLYITDGKGDIFESSIIEIGKSFLKSKISESKMVESPFKNITVSIPRLKNQDRFEFAIEKSIELGITNFIIFESERTIAKGSKIERWEKIGLAAMKQNLGAHLPRFQYCNKFSDLINKDCECIVFDLHGTKKWSTFLQNDFQLDKRYLLVFGPEGGLSEDELNYIKDANYYINRNRLRSETAVISAISLMQILL
ncbi:MAG: 16S rRNA (uracil(1498)-N(3))-methyltransferase [Melioribacteraceae bacterium]|nr:16S rRNA (uracil(1498)-N(3))-methyltransferase [Melioribacteraceae bacterium]